MSTLLVPWLLDESKEFLSGCFHRHPSTPKIILLLKFISNNFTCIVTDNNLFMLCVLSEVALGRLIKQNESQALFRQKGFIDMLSSGLLFVEDWKFELVNDHMVLVVNKFRFLGNFGIPDLSKIPYLMDNDNVQQWLAKSRTSASQREEGNFIPDSQALPETFEPGEWNQVEAYLSSQMTPRPPKQVHRIVEEAFPQSRSPSKIFPGESTFRPFKDDLFPEERKQAKEGPEWQVPPEQWEIIMEQYNGAGLISSTKPQPKKSIDLTAPSISHHSFNTPKESPLKQPGTPTLSFQSQEAGQKLDEAASPAKNFTPVIFYQNNSSPLRNSQSQQKNQIVIEEEWTEKATPSKKLQFIAEQTTPTKNGSLREEITNEKMIDSMLEEKTPPRRQQIQEAFEKSSPHRPFTMSTSPMKSSQLMYQDDLKTQAQDAIRQSPVILKSSPMVGKTGSPLRESQIEKIDQLEKRLSSPRKSVHNTPLKMEHVQLQTPTTKLLSAMKTRTSPPKISMTPKRVLFREEEEGGAALVKEVEKENADGNRPAKRNRMYSDW
jgi:hypothetical protein